MKKKLKNEAPWAEARGFSERNTERPLFIRTLKGTVFWPRMYKFAILPCNGVGQVGANIAREAAYLIHARFPDKTILSSSPELIVSDKDALKTAKKYPLVLIEGCMQRCGENILYAKGIKPAFIISVPHICAKKNLSLAGETREKLGPRGRRLVKEIMKVFLNRDRA